jgi:MscS family membrane protein
LKAWNNMPDPWISAEEQVAERVRWEAQNQRLNAKWEALKRAIARPKTETEMRLDDMTKGFAHWLTTDYKIIAEDWKDPKVAFKGFADSRIHMQVDFYVDDIRLEHCDRKRRVMTEIAQEIHERFQHEGLVS